MEDLEFSLFITELKVSGFVEFRNGESNKPHCVPSEGYFTSLFRLYFPKWGVVE